MHFTSLGCYIKKQLSSLTLDIQFVEQLTMKRFISNSIIAIATFGFFYSLILGDHLFASAFILSLLQSLSYHDNGNGEGK